MIVVLVGRCIYFTWQLELNAYAFVVLLICALVAGLVAGLYKGSMFSLGFGYVLDVLSNLEIPCRQPNVTATIPDAVCTAQRPISVQVSGSNFMNADGKLPKVFWKDVFQNNKGPRQLTDCKKIKVNISQLF